jgi:CHAT domain-containing protein/Tfp pilus assembly protein PilF
MPLTVSRLAQITVVLATVSVVFADEPVAKNAGGERGVKPSPVVLSDDFQHDSRPQYTLVGPVAWEKGMLILPQGSGVEKPFRSAPVVEIELHLHWRSPKNSQKRQLEVVAWKDSLGSRCVVLEQTGGQPSGQGEIRLFRRPIANDSSADRPASKELEVRRFALPASFPAGPIRLRYCYGVLKIFVGQKELACGHLPENSQVGSSIAVRCLQGECAVQQISVVGDAPLDLSSQQWQRLNAAGQSLDEVYRLRDAGRFAEARKRLQAVQQTRGELVGQEHLLYAVTLCDMGYLCDALGEHAQAELAFHKSLEIRQRTFGAEHPYYAESLIGLAQHFQNTREYSRAEPLYQEALAIRKRILGENHRDYALSLNMLALLYFVQEDYARAEPLYELIVKTAKRVVFNKDADATLISQARQGLATTWPWLVGRYRDRQDWPGAIRRQRELSEFQAHMYGKDDYRAADARRELEYLELLARLPADDARQLLVADQQVGKAWELRGQGNAKAAQPLAEEALRVHQRLLGENNCRTAKTLFLFGALQLTQGNNARAEASLRQASAILKELLGEKHPDYATILNHLASCYHDRADYARAEPLYQQALEIQKSVLGENDSHCATTLNNLASLYKDWGDYARAEPLYEQALEIRKKSLGENHPDYATSMNDLAALYAAKGDYAKAVKLHRQALDIRRRVLGENAPAYAQSVNNLAATYYDQGDYAQAEPLYQKALEIRKRILGENSPEFAGSLNDLAVLYAAKGDYAKAVKLHQQALDIRRRVLGENAPAYAQSLNNLAEVHCDQGNYATAELLHQKALEIRKRALGENHPVYANSLHNLAAFYEARGDYARAEPLYLEALEIVKRTLGENHPEYAGSLNNLACLYDEQADYTRAEPLFRKALEIRKSVLGENHPDYAISLNNLAFLYNEQGDYTRAKPLYQKALEIAKRVFGENHHGYACSLSNLACLYFDHGEYARAEPLCRQALEITKRVLGPSRPFYATTLNNLAVLYDNQGDYPRAESLYQEALEIRMRVLGENHPEYAISLKNLADLYYAQGDYARAEPPYRQAVAIIRKQLDSTAAVQSERQQLAMLQSARGYLDCYLTLAARSNRFVESVYREVLAWKGIVLRRQRQARAGGETPELLAIFAQLQMVAAQLSRLAWATPEPKQEAGWRERVDQLSAKKDRLEAELSSHSTAYRQAKQQVTLEDVQAALPQDAVLVDFLEYSHCTPADRKAGTKDSWEHRLLAFVITPGRPVEMLHLGAVAPLGEAIDTWRKTFGMSPQGAAAGRLLRQRIWEPIEGKLGSAKIVLVSPDGTMGRLPLGALPGKEPGRYLLEEHTIALVPVPQLIPGIVNELGRKQLQKNLLLLGNVDYDAQPDKLEPETPGAPTRGLRAVRSEDIQFPPLPATKTEIAAIGRLYSQGLGHDGVTTLEEKRATKQAFRTEAGRYEYVHVATHGFFAPATQRSALAAQPQELSRFAAPQQVAQAGGLHPGLLSGLVLAGANQAGKHQGVEALDADDGIATAEEIGTLNLEGVELVMLSACETGLGQTAGGEGLLGLQRAFQTASARTVVASLWEVDDDGTRALMIEFYKNLWERKLGKLEALRQAQLTMLREYDPKAGKLRGVGALSPVDPAKLAAAEKGDRPKPLSPFYWAAFVLSGDWR